MIDNIQKDVERVGRRAYREKQREMEPDMKLSIIENAIKTDGTDGKISRGSRFVTGDAFFPLTLSYAVSKHLLPRNFFIFFPRRVMPERTVSRANKSR